ncbi:MAG: AAA family ATPase [Desulfohalobiaceae bacterium]
MDYYKLLNLSREPFSNSPDPELFFRSSRHAACLQKLEIALRLRRGLCVVSGEVGTGKTTICRHLLRTTAGDDSLQMHLILDPSFDNEPEMLSTINSMFNGPDQAAQCESTWQHKEMIKDYLFYQGVDKQKTIALVLDEGQKLTPAGAEILRELLNFETNEQKLLQIIIFAQMEIDQLLEKMPNFADRISLYHQLLPLSRKETALFIKYRLDRSCADPKAQKKVYFTRRALHLVHSMTGGYPRKIINLGHNILLTLIIKGTPKVSPSVVRHAAQNLQALNQTSTFARLSWAAAVIAVVLAFLWIFTPLLPNPAFMSGIFFGNQDQSASEPDSSSVRLALNHENSPPFAALPPGHKETSKTTSAEDVSEESNKQVISSHQVHTKYPGPHNLNPPQRLGFIQVNSKENLWDIAQGIFGTGTQDLLQEIIQANPGIENPDLIYQGQRINIPSAGFGLPEEHQRYWIATSRHTELDKAYDAMFEDLDRLRLLCTWDPASGLQHHVVLDMSFPSAQQAQKTAQDLAKEVSNQAKVLDVDGMYIVNVAKP